ncbi:MAG: hypothetical protein Q4P66_08565 [Actinomycetaceae bacterium]|nr:hypothetical protein [Actinomycetaceae bacterium]
MSDKLVVAFICQWNNNRSQVAEAIAKEIAADAFEAYSAGTHVAHHLNRDTVRLMKILYSIDLTQTQHPKLLNEIPRPHIIITIGSVVQYPPIPCLLHEHWIIPNPAGSSDNVFVDTIISIRMHVIKLRARVLAKDFAPVAPSEAERDKQLASTFTGNTGATSEDALDFAIFKHIRGQTFHKFDYLHRSHSKNRKNRC